MKKVGRPLAYPETLLARLPEGTKQRIAAALKEGETQADFARAGILAELDRREGEEGGG